MGPTAEGAVGAARDRARARLPVKKWRMGPNLCPPARRARRRRRRRSRRMHKYDYAHIRTRYFSLHFRLGERGLTTASADLGHISTASVPSAAAPTNTFITVPLVIRRRRRAA